MRSSRLTVSPEILSRDGYVRNKTRKENIRFLKRSPRDTGFGFTCSLLMRIFFTAALVERTDFERLQSD